MARHSRHSEVLSTLLSAFSLTCGPPIPAERATIKYLRFVGPKKRLRCLAERVP